MFKLGRVCAAPTVGVRSGPEPVRVQPAAAHMDHGTGTAGRAQRGDSALPRRDRRVGGHLVDSVTGHVHPGRGGSVERGLHRIRLFPVAIGVDHQRVPGVGAQGLRKAGPAPRGGQHRIEDPDGNASAVLDPAPIDLHEPIRVGVPPTGWAVRRTLPGGVRQQQVQVRWLLGRQCPVNGDGIVGEVHRAENPSVKIAVCRTAKERQRVKDLGIAATAVREYAVPVVSHPIPVERHADLDPVLAEHGAPLFVQQQSVAVDAQVEAGNRPDLRNQHVEQRAHSGLAQKQRLSAVQDHEYVGEPVPDRVLADSLRRHRDGL